jgi:hypothetical protein
MPLKSRSKIVIRVDPDGVMEVVIYFDPVRANFEVCNCSSLVT